MAADIKPKMLAPWTEIYDKPIQHIKKQRHHFVNFVKQDKIHFSIRNFINQVPCSQSYGFSSSCIQMWDLDHKEGCVLKNWYFQIVVLGNTLESLLDSKEIKLVNTQGNQSQIFIGRAGVEAEAPILWATWCEVMTHWNKDPDPGERLKAKKRKSEEQRMSWLDSSMDSMNLNLSRLRDSGGRGAWCTAVHGVIMSQTSLTEWMTRNDSWEYL